MSRGHGVWQRRIMEEAATARRVNIKELAAGGGRSAVVAARRAAKRLAEDGEVRAFYVGGTEAGGWGWDRGRNNLCVTLPDGDPRYPSSVPPQGYPDWITRECDSCAGWHSALANDPMKCQ